MIEIEWLSDQQWNAGWIDDPEAVQAVCATLDQPEFSQTEAADLALSDLPKECFLWKDALRVVKALHLKPEDQKNVGSCVSFGCARAIEYSNLVEIANGDQEEFKYLCRPVIYGGSRVEIGGGKIRGDGSIGAWAAKFVTSYGVIDQGKYAGYNLADYSPALCREWGSKGVPDALENFIKEHKVSNTTLVKTVDEAQKALAQGYGISVCSNQGFTTRRDPNGICYPSGSWNHCMSITGYTTIKDTLYFYIENSWGQYLGTSNLAPNQANYATFLAKHDVVARMLAQNDSFAFAGLNGFKKRKLDWTL